MNNSQPTFISAIVAMSENRVIGNGNHLPWHLPADLKHFKTLTTGHPILMGRKTYESIGRPLPNRTNIIMTRDTSFQAPGCIVVTSIEKALAHATDIGRNEIFIIGGAEIYKQLLPKISRLYMTVVHAKLDGDAFFPELNFAEWNEITNEKHEADENNEYAYSFITLEKIELLQ